MLLMLKRRWGADGRGRDDGQGTVEYVGIVLVVALILASVTVPATPIGNALMSKLCGVFGIECSVSDTGAPDDEPPDIDCVQNTSESVVAIDVSLLFFDQGSNVGIMTEELSDGTYRVTLVDGGSFGVSTGVGAFEAEVRIGDQGGVFGAGASAGVALEGAIGTEYIFTNPQDLADFYSWASEEQASDLIGGMSPLMGLAADGVDGLVDWVTGNSYSPPEPTAHYVEGGVVINGHAMAGAVAGLSGDVSVAGTIGVRKDNVTGETTVYAKVSGEGDAAADGGFATLSASGEVESVVAMTLDSSGKLVNIQVESMMAGSADLSVLGVDDDDEPSASAGTRVVMALPVTDENRQQVIESLNGVGVIKGIADGSGPAAPVSWLMQEVASNGDIIVQDIDVDNANDVSVGLAAELPVVKGAGASFSSGTKTTVVNRTRYLGRHGLLDMEGCGGTSTPGSSFGGGRG